MFSPQSVTVECEHLKAASEKSQAGPAGHNTALLMAIKSNDRGFTWANTIKLPLSRSRVRHRATSGVERDYGDIPSSRNSLTLPRM